MALLTMAGPSAAQAQTQAVSYAPGTYSGKLIQVVPKPYAGALSFVVSQGKITGLTATFGVVCQSLGWVRDKDPLPALAISVGPRGGFSYVGKVDGRHLRLSGILTGHRVVGSFFQTFWLGHDFCTMSRPAFYSAIS